LDNYGPERYQSWDGPALGQVLDREGAIYELSDAKGDVAKQESDIDAFAAARMDVIIVQPFADGSPEYNGSVPAAVKRATAAGIPVISYDKYLESPNVLYVAFDWVEAGRMQARAILAARPKGNYVIIKGDADSPLADMQRHGIGEVLQPALDSGAIKIVGETYTDNWDPYQAELEMDAILKQNANRIDAVIVEDDGMASGVIKSLTEAGLAGKVAVSGVGGFSGFPSVSNFNAIARGVQTVSVWQDYRQLGRAAAEAAVALCGDRDIAKLSGTTRVTSPGGNQLTSILLPSQLITKDNLNVMLDTGWIKKDDLCRDVDPATTPAACR
jgi:D-xylose transport system substrate-binding protein